jgi:two-component system, response regulator RegA
MIEKRILVVDDENAFLMAIRKILEGTGLLVDTAENYSDALNFLRIRSFDYVITDIRLTNVINAEGLKILMYVKEHRPETKVIILTGYGNAEIMEKAYSMGANLYLEKPISGNILRSILVNSGGV